MEYGRVTRNPFGVGSCIDARGNMLTVRRDPSKDQPIVPEVQDYVVLVTSVLS